MTYRQLFSSAIGKGLAAHEATLLLEHIFGLSHSSLLVHMDDICDESLSAKFENTLSRRLEGYPLQYLLGEWEFFGLPFYVGEGVLIPRADTEVLVETVLDLCKDNPAPKVCDLCSGSGCIPIALSKNLPPQSLFTAVELSDKALCYLNKNKERHSCGNISVVHGDVTVWTPQERFDIITSNPPYISHEEMLTLQPEVLKEPVMALQAEDNGLYFYRVLSARCAGFLNQGGWLIFEIGYSQGKAVSQMMEENGFSNISVIPDYSGNDRVVIGQMNKPSV